MSRLIAMSGLPGTGKSTPTWAVAIFAVVLNTDEALASNVARCMHFIFSKGATTLLRLPSVASLEARRNGEMSLSRL